MKIEFEITSGPETSEEVEEGLEFLAGRYGWKLSSVALMGVPPGPHAHLPREPGWYTPTGETAIYCLTTEGVWHNGWGVRLDPSGIPEGLKRLVQEAANE